MAKLNARLAGIILFFSLSITISKAQYVYIPDSAFRAFLISNGFAPALNVDSLDTTSSIVSSTTMMNCSGRGIQSLDGIQYFHSLTYLDCSVNYLNVLPNLSDSIITLNCEKNLLSALPTLPLALKNLYCSRNFLQTLPQLPPSLISLSFSNNQVDSLPPLPLSLQVMWCDSNAIHNIPPLPQGFNSLLCAHNLLTSLPALPSSLTNLFCASNFITQLPGLPGGYGFIGLDVSENPIHALPAVLPPGLFHLYCQSCQLDSLPTLPQSLQTLEASYNNLVSLPALPVNLKHLSVNENNLTVIPALPPYLDALEVSVNHISSLPALPNTLTQLLCASNPLYNLPSLPTGLVSLFCAGDSLSALPPLPASLRKFNCQLNSIHTLPDLPDSMDILGFGGNPISCLPPIHYIKEFNWVGTNITCIPNTIQVLDYALPAIDTLPLCQPSSGCPVNWNISGNIYHDLNSDCVRDTNEQELKNIPVLLDSAGSLLQICYTNANGDYSFRTGLGNYRVRINPTGILIPYICPATGSYTSQLTPIDSMDANRDFALTCPPAFDLYAGSITPEILFRPTRLVKVNINAGDLLGHFGTACFTDTGFVQCNFTGPISYVGPVAGALTPTVVSPGSLRWNVNDFSVVDPSTSFNIEVRVDSFAMINDPICFNLSIYPFIGDIFPLDNYTSACYPVRVAVDPNEKYMYPSGSVDTSDHVFNFTIFFQNTGNAPAEDIYIIDTLDNDLDASSFEFLSSTHEVVTQMLPGNILRFNFHGINLVDSVSNEALSHGQVNFRLHRKATTGMGTEITNTAYIYFDQNAPVATNEVYAIVTSLVGIPVVDQSEKLLFYPNPARGMIRIANKIVGKARVEIRAMTGNVIESFASEGDEIAFDSSPMSSGVYLVSVTDSNGRRVGRIILEK